MLRGVRKHRTIESFGARVIGRYRSDVFAWRRRNRPDRDVDHEPIARAT